MTTTSTVTLLTKAQRTAALKKLADWDLNKAETVLTKKINCGDFVTALAFCARVAVHAEVLQHHPDIHIQYSKVTLKLTTHDAKGITKLDIELAKRIDDASSTQR